MFFGRGERPIALSAHPRLLFRLSMNVTDVRLKQFGGSHCGRTLVTLEGTPDAVQMLMLLQRCAIRKRLVAQFARVRMLCRVRSLMDCELSGAEVFATVRTTRRWLLFALRDRCCLAISVSIVVVGIMCGDHVVENGNPVNAFVAAYVAFDFRLAFQ